jgi:hypothetical protein
MPSRSLVSFVITRAPMEMAGRVHPSPGQKKAAAEFGNPRRLGLHTTHIDAGEHRATDNNIRADKFNLGR